MKHRGRARATDRNRKQAHSSNEKFFSINYGRMEKLKRESERERDEKGLPIKSEAETT